MATLPKQSQAIETLNDQMTSLDLIAKLARRLSRRFGTPGSEQDWADFLVALDRERTTRAAYQAAIHARRAASGEDGGR
jgi:hypothetical protein